MERTPSETLPGEVETFMQGFVSADADDNVLLGARFHDSVVIGTTTLTAAGGWDMFVAKYSPQGAPIWARRWGGAGNEYVRTVVAGAHGDIFVAGTFDQAMTFGSANLATWGDRDALVGRLDSNGQPIWSRHLGGTGLDTCDRMTVDRDGNPAASGQFYATANLGMGNVTAAGEWDAWVTKWNWDGTPLWSHPIGGVGTDLSWGVAAGPQGETIVSGFFHDTVDFGEGPRTSVGDADFFVTKYAADGSFVWSQQFGGPGYDTSGYVKTDDAGRVYVMGWFGNSITLGGTWYPYGGMYLLQLAP
jgi:hypothetical protein